MPAGEEVIVQGEIGDRFFLIEQGEVEVFENGVFRRNEGPGESFGEIALLRDVPRTATVRTTAQTRLLVLERDQFLLAVSGHRRSHQVAHTVIDDRWPGEPTPARALGLSDSSAVPAAEASDRDPVRLGVHREADQAVTGVAPLRLGVALEEDAAEGDVGAVATAVEDAVADAALVLGAGALGELGRLLARGRNRECGRGASRRGK